MMTKKHYKAIAEAFKAHVSKASDHMPVFETFQLGTLKTVATDLCVVFKKDNPAFQPSKFLDACGFPAPDYGPEPDMADAEALVTDDTNLPGLSAANDC